MPDAVDDGATVVGHDDMLMINDDDLDSETLAW